jgi:hypothetical protein
VTKRTSILLCFLLLGVVAADAQEKPAARPLTALELEVVIGRYDGAKRLSNLPYTLAVNSNDVPVQLNMGTQVAVPTTGFQAAGDAKASPIVSYNYRDVGTKILAAASMLDDGRFQVNLQIDDSSVYTSPTPGPGGTTMMPAFRNFSSRNTLLLRDGQMREYTAATDRVSGEVVKVSVTLKVVK